MCGRYTSAKPIETYAELFKAKAGNLFVEPRYNIAPTYDVLACRAIPAGRELTLLHWGLIPSWAEDKKIGYRTINARAETVAVKPSYRTAFRRRRCLIAADGFYEWQPGKPRKQPYYIRIKEGRPFAFAGLWERWEPEGQQAIESCTIIVITANGLIGQIHDRMPVIVSPKDYDLWLDPEVNEPEQVAPLLKPYPENEMEMWPVGLQVNSPKHDGEGLIQRL
jgi:putative SOS response-associated peptidase YedK